MNQYRQLTSEEKKIVGTYERKSGANTFRYVLLDNRQAEDYSNEHKSVDNSIWSIVGQKVHIEATQERFIAVFSINADGNLNSIANIIDGIRRDFTKEQQTTYKKIK